ncbi:MAG: type IV secretory system conjugative DNA transfer family protein [Clostridia bacterium]|jgi:type IV secretory pathway TraG/TraD family ATPase VirD4|nr:type IV secretory system conjugative DNA transfer family protein [Clostridia bacterium]
MKYIFSWMNLQIFGQIPDFNRKISTVRSRRNFTNYNFTKYTVNLRIVIRTGLSDEIIGNCDERMNMSTTDILTAQYFCNLLGVATAETSSIRKSNSLEGDLEEYGQKNISTLERNLMNVDEILRLPITKLMLSLRGNKPILLDKMIYKEHPLAIKLQDSPISRYNPKWIKNNPKQITIQEKKSEKVIKKEKISWDNF